MAPFGTDGQIEGGTAWGVTMFIDLHGWGACEVYLFEPSLQGWLTWNSAWEPIAAPPRPHGVWAGIGTRNLDTGGEAATTALLAP